MTPPAPTSSASHIVAVTGATGMIGSALVAALEARGSTVRRLVRASNPARPNDVVWDPSAASMNQKVLEGCHAVVNLAGAPIAQRWTAEHKRAIRESRVGGTSLLARTIAAMEQKPAVVLSGSAVGFYGDRGDERLDEGSAVGRDFLASVVLDWETAAAPIAAAGVRLVLLRTGIVLSTAGGALAKLLPPFNLGVGGPMGSGRQWMSWITLHDQVRAMLHALDTTSIHGPLNLVTPNPVQNADFANTLGSVLHRPTILPTPAFALKLMFGEMAEATILAGQRIAPKVLAQSGFAFDTPELEPALRSILGEPA